MLTHYQYDSKEAAMGYFEEELSKGDYYADGASVAGSWHGVLAETLGLQGRVVAVEDFEMILHNKHPETEERLRPRLSGKAGYDLTFTCPKGVSMLDRLAQDRGNDRIHEAIMEAVHETMADMQRDVHVRVRAKGQCDDQQTGSWLYAAFKHEEGRPIDGVADPHSHVHCFVPNLSHDGEGYKAIQLFYVLKKMPYYEACYHSRLAYKLEELGLKTEIRGKFWDIEAIPHPLVEKFSQRSHVIAEDAGKKGLESEKAIRTISAIDTRQDKAQIKQSVPISFTERLEASERALLEFLVSTLPEEAEEAEEAPSGVCEPVKASSVATDPEPALKQHILEALEQRLDTQPLLSAHRVTETVIRHCLGKAPLETITRWCQQLVEWVKAGIETLKTIGAPQSQQQTLYSLTAVSNYIRDGCNVMPRLGELHAATLPSQITGVTKQQLQAAGEILRSTHMVTLVRGKAGEDHTQWQSFMQGKLQQAGYDCIHMSAGNIRPQELEKVTGNAILWVDQAQKLSALDWHHLTYATGTKALRVIAMADNGLKPDVMQHVGKRAGISPITLYEHSKPTLLQQASHVLAQQSAKLGHALGHTLEQRQYYTALLRQDTQQHQHIQGISV